jgi:GNAT superfamily N-acetyltransferase
MRNYSNENDFWLIRNFLREILVINGLREYSWHVARLDYWRWHCIDNCHSSDPLQEVTFLWEKKTRQIVAVLNPEERGQVFMHVHPAFQTGQLEEEMIAFAEERLAVDRVGKRRISIWADSQDNLRLGILKRRGYSKGRWTANQWRRDLDEPIPEVSIAPGYIIRSLGDDGELPSRSWASWRGFHPEEPDEKYEGWEWYRNIQRCPLYRRDLDMVASTGDVIAACATFWYDDFTRTAMIEPVVTMPEHQRRGLARAILTEGMRRLQRMGALRVFVSGYEEKPDALYSSVLSPACDHLEEWVKEW